MRSKIEEYVNNLTLVDNPNTHGKYAIIEKNGAHYYASMADLGRYLDHMPAGHADFLDYMGGRYEVMIFPCDENGAIASWSEEFCRRSKVKSDDFLRECIKDFLQD